MAARKNIYISSTALDLPAHREEVREACLRQGLLPTMCESLPPSEMDAVAASLRMVDDADIYLGILGHRYGYVPTGFDLSTTEMEYDRAVERGLPCLIFLMHNDHMVKASDIETGRGASRLKAFKERLKQEQTVAYFVSPLDLRRKVISSLIRFRQRGPAAFHFVRQIPAAPAPYVAHPYTLLQVRDLIGRQAELGTLTDWVCRADSELYRKRIFNITAIGGMGKSALAWTWFREVAPFEMRELAGRMWWSFYESDATHENFVSRALAYTTGRPREEIEERVEPRVREELLLAELDKKPFLIVLDGLERLMIAYARGFGERAFNAAEGAPGAGQSAARDLEEAGVPNRTIDPRVGNFLRKLASVRAARILITTRLEPADLEAANGEPLPGVHFFNLQGLSDPDALMLWRGFRVSGPSSELLKLFRTFENHPLLIQALASEIAHYGDAPRDFEAWREQHPNFDPFSLPLEQRKEDILAFALRDLNEPAMRVLRIVAAFRMPAAYDMLAALLVAPSKTFQNENALDATLSELESRGLLGWDKRANRYDLHPIVRGVVWNRLDAETRRANYQALYDYLSTIPPINDEEVKGLEDLTPTIELYNALIGLERYDEAVVLYYQRLLTPIYYRLSAGRQRTELLEMLFPDGPTAPPRLSTEKWRAFATDDLGLSYDFIGLPRRAVMIYRSNRNILEEIGEVTNLVTHLTNFSDSLRSTGSIYESEAAARRALGASRGLTKERFSEGTSLRHLGMTLALRGEEAASESALRRGLRLLLAHEDRRWTALAYNTLAQRALWMNDPAASRELATSAASVPDAFKTTLIRAARLQGASSLALDDLPVAEEFLNQAVIRARTLTLVEEELPSLIQLAELRRRQGAFDAARELLDEVWELIERGPYPLQHADASNVLARIEWDEKKDAGAAMDAATRAYQSAWCDGPPFAYHWGLEKARALLKELGAGESEMPAFDASKFEQMPEVEIDPPDEFGAEGDGGGALGAG